MSECDARRIRVGAVVRYAGKRAIVESIWVGLRFSLLIEDGTSIAVSYTEVQKR